MLVGPGELADPRGVSRSGGAGKSMVGEGEGVAQSWGLGELKFAQSWSWDH